MQRQQNSAHALGARGNAENEEKKAAFFSQLPPFSLASFRLPFFFVLPVFDRQLVPGLDGRLFNWPVGWSVVQLVIFFLSVGWMVSQLVGCSIGPLHYGTKPGHFGTSIIHFPTSEGVSKVSERANE